MRISDAENLPLFHWSLIYIIFRAVVLNLSKHQDHLQGLLKYRFQIPYHLQLLIQGAIISYQVSRWCRCFWCGNHTRHLILLFYKWGNGSSGRVRKVPRITGCSRDYGELPQERFSHLSPLAVIKRQFEDFLGGPVVKTLHSQCRGHRFDPWLGN